MVTMVTMTMTMMINGERKGKILVTTRRGLMVTDGSDNDDDHDDER